MRGFSSCVRRNSMSQATEHSSLSTAHWRALGVSGKRLYGSLTKGFQSALAHRSEISSQQNHGRGIRLALFSAPSGGKTKNVGVSRFRHSTCREGSGAVRVVLATRIVSPAHARASAVWNPGLFPAYAALIPGQRRFSRISRPRVLACSWHCRRRSMIDSAV
jgi:hypothetical protein